MPLKLYEIPTGEKGPGNIIDETVLSEGGAITATTPAFTDSRNLDTSTNTAPTVRRFKRKTTGTPAAGIGAGIDFEVQTGAANHEVGAVIQAVTTDVTAASEDFDLVFSLMLAGAPAAEYLRLNGATGRFGNIAGGFRSGNNSVNNGFTSAFFGLGSTSIVKWSSDGNGYSGTYDIGEGRKAAGVHEFNNGTRGSYAGCAWGAGSQTVAQLPAAATAGAGARSFVTDATATNFLSTVAGGGVNGVPVVSNGTNWLIG